MKVFKDRDLNSLKRKELLELPSKDWQEEKVYDFLLIVPSGKKHDSGYSLIAVVGVLQGETQGDGFSAEIAAYCDDICWTLPKEHPYGKVFSRPGYNRMMLRTDMLWPAGIARVWGSGEAYFTGRFRVGCSLSSTDVTLEVWPRGAGKNPVTGEVIEMPVVEKAQHLGRMNEQLTIPTWTLAGVGVENLHQILFFCNKSADGRYSDTLGPLMAANKLQIKIVKGDVVISKEPNA